MPDADEMTLPLARKVALVVSAGPWRRARRPGGAADGAALMATLLTRIGFRVLPLHNPDHHILQAGLRNFRADLRGADVGLFYFSGRGFRDAEGDLHLLPVGAAPGAEGAPPPEAFALRRIMHEMEESAATGLVFLDLGPLNAPGRGGEAGGPVTLAIAEGVPGAFTGALVRQLERPGHPLARALEAAAEETGRETGGRVLLHVPPEEAGQVLAAGPEAGGVPDAPVPAATPGPGDAPPAPAPRTRGGARGARALALIALAGLTVGAFGPLRALLGPWGDGAGVGGQAIGALWGEGTESAPVEVRLYGGGGTGAALLRELGLAHGWEVIAVPGDGGEAPGGPEVRFGPEEMRAEAGLLARDLEGRALPPVSVVQDPGLPGGRLEVWLGE